jgi:hypothetical protein
MALQELIATEGILTDTFHHMHMTTIAYSWLKQVKRDATDLLSPITALSSGPMSSILAALTGTDHTNLAATCRSLHSHLLHPTVQCNHIDLFLLSFRDSLADANIDINSPLDSDHLPITMSINLAYDSSTQTHMSATRVFATAKLNLTKHKDSFQNHHVAPWPKGTYMEAPLK